MPRSDRLIYHAPSSLTSRRRDALIVAWAHLACEARFARDARDTCAAVIDSCSSRMLTRAAARRLASDARDLIAAFGIRWDKRKSSPFPQQFAPCARKAAA